MRTGFEAMRFGWTAYVVPVLFVASPSLLLIGSPQEVAIAVVERRAGEGREFVYFGPRLDAPPLDVIEGSVLFDEPGVRAVQFSQRAQAVSHFLRATGGVGAIVNVLSRRAPEVRHLRRWLAAIIHELDHPRAMVGGWFAAGAAGCLFAGGEEETTWRYIEVGLES